MGVEGAPPGLLDDWVRLGNGANAKIGIVFVHGFTGSPSSLRPWAEFFAARGYTVRLPRLAGHGTRWQDLNEVRWQQWPERVLEELREIRKVCSTVFIFGLSMGGTISLFLAAHESELIDGIVLVNPMVHIPGLKIKFGRVLSIFRSHLPSVGNDIKRRNVSEYGYDALPTKGVLELNTLLKNTRSTLGLVVQPMMLFHSVEDHTLPLSNTEIVMSEIGSAKKQRIELINSYHVATLDYEADVIFENSLLFVQDISKVR